MVMASDTETGSNFGEGERLRGFKSIRKESLVFLDNLRSAANRELVNLNK